MANQTLMGPNMNSNLYGILVGLHAGFWGGGARNPIYTHCKPLEGLQVNLGGKYGQVCEPRAKLLIAFCEDLA